MNKKTTIHTLIPNIHPIQYLHLLAISNAVVHVHVCAIREQLGGTVRVSYVHCICQISLSETLYFRGCILKSCKYEDRVHYEGWAADWWTLLHY